MPPCAPLSTRPSVTSKNCQAIGKLPRLEKMTPAQHNKRQIHEACLVSGDAPLLDTTRDALMKLQSLHSRLRQLLDLPGTSKEEILLSAKQYLESGGLAQPSVSAISSPVPSCSTLEMRFAYTYLVGPMSNSTPFAAAHSDPADTRSQVGGRDQRLGAYQVGGVQHVFSGVPHNKITSRTDDSSSDHSLDPNKHDPSGSQGKCGWDLSQHSRLMGVSTEVAVADDVRQQRSMTGNQSHVKSSELQLLADVAIASSRLEAGHLTCVACGTFDTPKWRAGNTLCNACGLKCQRMK